jgi:hypothetical protein
MCVMQEPYYGWHWPADGPVIITVPDELTIMIQLDCLSTQMHIWGYKQMVRLYFTKSLMSTHLSRKPFASRLNPEPLVAQMHGKLNTTLLNRPACSGLIL